MNFQTLQSIVQKIDTNRAGYTALWRWAILFAGSNNTLRNSVQLGQFIKGNESIPSDNKSAIDPSILNLFDTAANFYAGLFFPENKPFAGVPVDDEVGEYDDLFDTINNAMYDAMKSRDTNFNDAKQKSYNDYILLGTKALLAQKHTNPDVPFWITNYSVQNMGFNMARDIFVCAYEWTADQVVENLTSGMTSKEYKLLPANVKQTYEQYDFETEFNVDLVIMKNREYKKGASGINGHPWIGYWIMDGVKEILQTDYFKERPIAESLYSVKTGEIYGRSPLTDRKAGFEIYDGVLYMITNNIAKIGDPATGYFDVGGTGFDYDTTPGTMTPFNGGLLNGQAPTFKIQDAGDITPAVQYLRPALYEALRIAYRIDAMVDLMTQKRTMTATEILTIEQLRNKMLSPIVRREVAETQPFKKRLFLLTARWLAERGKITQEDLQALENQTIEWKIKENSAVERIIESEDMAQFNNEINVVGAAIAVDENIKTAIDMYDSLDTVLEHGVIKLKPKAQYEQTLNQQKQLELLTQLSSLQRPGQQQPTGVLTGGTQPQQIPAEM